MNGRPTWRKEARFSNSSGVVWTQTESKSREGVIILLGEGRESQLKNIKTLQRKNNIKCRSIKYLSLYGMFTGKFSQTSTIHPGILPTGTI